MFFVGTSKITNKQTKRRKISTKKITKTKKITGRINSTTTKNLKMITILNQILDSLSYGTAKLILLDKTGALNIIEPRSQIPLSLLLIINQHDHK